MFNKKAQGLSLNVIIIAALALIVLVVLVFIFSGRLKIFGQSVENCGTLGGECSQQGYTDICIEQGTCKCPDSIGNAIYIQGTNCEEKNRAICCKKVF